MTSKVFSSRRLGLAALAAIAVAVGSVGAARADDRDLLRRSSGDPYVFILLDNSGSMNWSTRCTQEQLDAGECRQLCPDRDCLTPLNADDPASKFYQAKEALYEVLKNVEGVHFGFATYNQDGLNLRAKHWLYAAQTAGPTVPNWGAFPAMGETDVLGLQWNCDTGNGDNEIGCYPDNGRAADLSDAWERARVARLPKGGIGFLTTRTFYVRHPDSGGITRIYRVRYIPVAGSVLGDPTVAVTVDVDRCTNTACTTRVDVSNAAVTFGRLSDFNSWDNGAQRTDPQGGFFSQGQAADSPATGTCLGWDPNDDTEDDEFNGYSIRFPTFDGATDLQDEGDVIPPSWTDDNKTEILNRLAPNLLLGETDPDFRTARYFRDTPILAQTYLRLRNEAVRPLVAFGSTPLGFSLADFRTWWAGCEQGSCPGETGWKDIAVANDPDWDCRRKFLLVLSDGDDTCPGRDPCSFTASLHAQENVFTYVVGFGVQNTPGNKLLCMAANGGTGEPIFPQNKQELVDALNAIFGEIQEAPRAFAAAAVPSVQATVEDKIFLSSFTPLNNEPLWDGHLDAYLKPLPLTDDGQPDDGRACASLPADEQGQCHLWDAGEVLLTQAPDQAEIDAGNLRLGNAADQRRVFYAHAKDLTTEAVPRGRSLLEPPTTSAARQDLWDGLGLVYDAADLTDGSSTPAQATEAIIEQTLIEKEGVIEINEDEDPEPEEIIEVTYALGDIFHSNPIVVENPDDFRAFAANFYGPTDPDVDPDDCADAANRGYRCFAKKHRVRRKMLAVGANDGMLHLFDAGIWDPDSSNPELGRFDNGTGTELLAFVPRLVLPVVRELAEGSRQIFAVDGTPRAVDVFIDPVHSASDAIDPDDRQWRTLLVGGLREGGIRNGGSRVELENGKPFAGGYFALDVTQPDKLNSDNEPINRNLVPTCLSAYDASACGLVPFGAELWEFTDSHDGSPAEWGTAFDEDANGYPDLGDTWSTPTLGRIKVADGSGGTLDRWVAIFGGGFDPDNKTSPRRGTWLYMVDVETGEAIYKRPLEGAAPANPAGVDRDRDGYIDSLYVGTTAGFMYKVDLSVPQPLETVDIDLDNDSSTSGDVVQVERVTAVEWSPFKVFDTGGRQLFFAPTVIFVGESGDFALVFGSGNREDLWDDEPLDQRLYVIVDEGWDRADSLGGSPSLPKNESNYTLIDNAGAANSSSNFLLSPPSGRNRGWIVTLDDEERVVSQPFSLSGVTVFSTFLPRVDVEDEGGGGGPPGGEEGPICARVGDSRIYVTFTYNADSLLPDPESGTADRFIEASDTLVTPPYVDQSATSNFVSEEPALCTDEFRQAMKQKLMAIFPPGTRFANYEIQVNFLRDDKAPICPVPIPVGIVEKNWKEFQR